MADRPLYIPLIKTTDAELRGYKNLSDEVKNAILPLFELTRSRTSSRVPEGDIHRRMQQIEEATGNNRPFILDLTSHPDLWNSQIEELLQEDDGFRNWYDFLCEYEHLTIYPVVHVYEDGNRREITREARRLHSKFGRIAFRFDVFDENINSFLTPIYEGIGNGKDLILILDCGYLGHSANINDVATECRRNIQEILAELSEPSCLAVAASSFPKSVTEHPDGDDDYGEIRMREVDLFDVLNNEIQEKKLLQLPLIYSDFASIHPYRYQTRGGGWVPRVDVPLDKKYIYTRYRRSAGGYVQAASRMLDEDAFESIESWGNEQIYLAAEDDPNGLSPSFWIAVRLNIHITRKVHLTPPFE